MRNNKFNKLLLLSITSLVITFTTFAGSYICYGNETLPNLKDPNNQLVINDFNEEPFIENAFLANMLKHTRANIKLDLYSKKYDSLFVINITDKKVDHINVYSEKNGTSKVTGVLRQNDSGYVIESDGDWYYITSGKFKGYIPSKYILIGDNARDVLMKQGVITTNLKENGTYVYRDDNSDSTIIGLSNNQTKYTILEFKDNGKYVKLQIKDDMVGWVKVSALKDIDASISTAISTKEFKELGTLTTADAKRLAIVKYAKKFLGNKYVWGGTSLTKGCDCSGYTMRLYEHFGYQINRTSYTQVENGTKIDVKNVKNLKPGDLLFYYHTEKVKVKVKSKKTSDTKKASVKKTASISGNVNSSANTKLLSNAPDDSKEDETKIPETIAKEDTTTKVQTTTKAPEITTKKITSEKETKEKTTKASTKSKKKVKYKTVYKTTKRIGHVAMYIGDGKIIEAYDENHGIIISEMRNPCAAVRIIQDK